MLHTLEKETVEAQICELINLQEWDEASKLAKSISIPNKIEIDYARRTIKVFKTQMQYHNCFHSNSTRELERVFYGYKSLYN